MHKNLNTVREVYDIFVRLEKKHDLVNLDIAGVKIWQILRYEIFIHISEQLFGLGVPHEVNTNYEKLNILPQMLYNAFFNNGWFANRCDTLIFPHSRVQLVSNQYIDIHTKYFVNELVENNSDFIVFEKLYLLKHYTKKYDYVKYLDDSVFFVAVMSKLIRINIDSSQSFIQTIKNELIDSFGTEIDLEFIFSSRIKKYKAYYFYFIRLLLKLSPQRIYVVVSYSQPWLVRAAKDLGIKVVEFQHGAFSKYHLGYSYDKNYVLEYLPDEFLVWNQYWKDSCPFPIQYDNICIREFQFQIAEMRKYKKIKKIKNQVVVLSQGTISNKMAKIILDNFDFFKDKTIKYKLHPGEFKRYKSYSYLTELMRKDNVEIILQCDLYFLLATSEYQVGVYSTAIYEGLEFGLKTILCDLPFIEFMDDLLQAGKVDMVLSESH